MLKYEELHYLKTNTNEMHDWDRYYRTPVELDIYDMADSYMFRIPYVYFIDRFQIKC